jgi:hypothetical protein
MLYYIAIGACFVSVLSASALAFNTNGGCVEMQDPNGNIYCVNPNVTGAWVGSDGRVVTSLDGHATNPNPGGFTQIRPVLPGVTYQNAPNNWWGNSTPHLQQPTTGYCSNFDVTCDNYQNPWMQ